MNKPKKYISLKEASKLSGYSSDYIGQLIRGGKLGGKKVYSSVAWVTTEDAVKKYLEKAKAENGSGNGKKDKKVVIQLENKEIDVNKFSKYLMYLILIFVSIFMVIVLFVLSLSLEKNLQKKADEKAKNIVNNELNN